MAAPGCSGGGGGTERRVGDPAIFAGWLARLPGTDRGGQEVHFRVSR